MIEKNLKPSVLLIICLVGFPQISETIYSPSLPNIAHSLVTTNQLVQWTLSLYFIGFSLGVFYWGRLSDSIGRRRAMLVGITVYIIGSLSCLFSTSIDWLLFSRVLQGFGASCGSVVTQTIIREAFDDKERHKLFSIVGTALSIAPALGPFIGGYVNQWFGWRANFTVLVIMGFSLIIYGLFALPETLMKKQKPTRGSTFKVFLQLMKDKQVLGCIFIIGAINGLLFSYYAEAPFLFIRIIGISSSQYGWLGLFIALATLLGGMASHRLGHYFYKKTLVLVGTIIMMMSASLLTIFALLGWINHHHLFSSILLVMLPMMGIIFGSFGLVIPAILSEALVNYKNVLGTAGALFGFSYYILISGFTWLMGMFHNGTVKPMPIYFLGLSILVFCLFFISIKSAPSNK